MARVRIENDKRSFQPPGHDAAEMIEAREADSEAKLADTIARGELPRAEHLG